MRWLPLFLVALAGLFAPALSGDGLLAEGVMLALVLLVGVPHGAVDHITYQHASGQRSFGALLRFFGLYVAGLFVFAGALHLFPLIATIVFLVLSAWHFGHSHLDPDRNGPWDRLRGLALGILLLSAMMLPHADDSVLVLQYWLPADQALALLQWQLPITIGSAVAWTLAAWRTAGQRRSMIREGLLPVAVLFVSMNGGLAWTFVAYFCLGHSLDAWRTEFLFQQRFTSHFFRYYRESIPLTGAAFLFLALAVLGAQQSWWNWSWVWIAAVSGTIPHMLFLDHWVPFRAAAAERSDNGVSLLTVT